MIEISCACTACGQCISTCPTQALVMSARRPSVLEDRCILCLECVEICPVDAVAQTTRPGV